MKIVNDIRLLISEGKSKEALKDLWTKFSTNEYRDDALQLKARNESLQNQIVRGLVSHEELTLEENKITYSLLQLLNKIQEEEVKTTLVKVDRKLDDERLVKKLLEILNETYEGFYSQGKVRNLLYLKIKTRLSIKNSFEYEEFFQKYYSEMNDEELKYHKTLRDFTENVLRTYNGKALELVLGNEDLKKDVPILHELERHLLVWLGKYETVFKETPEVSLIYAGVKEKVPFPKGVEAKLEQYIKRNIKNN